MDKKQWLKSFVLSVITASIWMGGGMYTGYYIGYTKGYKQALTDEKGAVVNVLNRLRKIHER